MIVLSLYSRTMQERPTSLPAPKGVILRTSDDEVMGISVGGVFRLMDVIMVVLLYVDGCRFYVDFMGGGCRCRCEMCVILVIWLFIRNSTPILYVMNFF